MTGYGRLSKLEISYASKKFFVSFTICIQYFHGENDELVWRSSIFGYIDYEQLKLSGCSIVPSNCVSLLFNLLALSGNLCRHQDFSIAPNWCVLFKWKYATLVCTDSGCADHNVTLLPLPVSSCRVHLKICSTVVLAEFLSLPVRCKRW